MAQQVLDAVQCILDPLCAPFTRQHAHELLEQVKESDACLDVGFQLLQSSGNVSVQHCGLQFVEHVIRYKWNKLSSEKRLEIKDRCMNSIVNFTGTESPHALIMDGLAKCVVEMVKREWPQAWPEFMDECEELCSLGTYQTEIVLFVLSRLVEDVIVFNTVEYIPQNKQLHIALVHWAGTLLDMPLNVVEMSHSFPSSTELEKENVSRLCVAALSLLANMLNWVSAQLLTGRMPRILTALRSCLESNSVSLARCSAACLNELVTRKGPRKELEPLLTLLTLEHMQPVVATLRKFASNVYEEETYALFKAVNLLLVPIASSLASFWDSSELSDHREQILNLMLCTCLFLLRHPSLRARCLASQAMLVLAKKPPILPCGHYRSAYREFLQIVPAAIAKIGMPSSSEEPYCTFSRVDYDSNTEFLVDSTRTRDCCYGVIREDVRYTYAVSYDFALAWLRDVLYSPEQATASSLFEAYSSVYAIICEALLRLDEQAIEGISETATSHLDMVMKAIDDQLSNPECLTKLLSLVSGLFPFLKPTYWRIPEYLTKLMSLLLIGDSERWHCVNLHVSHQLTKLSMTCQKILLPHFNLIWSELQKIGDKLTDHMKCNLVDMLFEVSNGLNSYEYQRNMTSSVLSSTVQFWNSASIVDALSSSENFLAYLGLFEPVSTDPASDTLKVKRKEFFFHTNILSSIMNHISLSGDPQALSEGGFTVTDSSGTSRIRHPAFDTFQQLLPSIFRFARCLNGIYQESCAKKVHPTYGGQKVLDIVPAEKLTIIGTYNKVKNEYGEEKLLMRTTVEDHMRGFFSDITDNIFMLICKCVCRLKWQFYETPNASAMLEHGLLGNAEHSLDYRLHTLIRKAIIPIVNNTQGEYFSCLLNPLAKLFSHCYQRLSAGWQLVAKNMDQALQDSDRDLTDQEVYLEHSSSMLTRDVALLVRSVLMKRPGRKDKHENGSATDEHEEDGTEELMLVDMSSLDVGGDLSPWGKQLLNDKCFPSLVLLMFHMLSCQDTVPIINISSLCYPVVVELLDKKLLDEPSARHLYSCILYGVQQHCHVDDLLGKLFDLGCKLHELFHAPFQNACKEVLLSIPKVSKEAVEMFEQKIQSSCDGSAKIPDKVKRTMFKKLVKPITDPRAAFKRQQQFRELPSLLKPPRAASLDLHCESDLRYLFGGS